MVAILMMSAKVVTLGLLIIKVFWNKYCDVIISVHDNFIMIWQKKFLEGCSWFKFNNLGLVLGMAFEILHKCGKRVKTKSQKVLGANFYVCRISGE